MTQELICNTGDHCWVVEVLEGFRHVVIPKAGSNLIIGLLTASCQQASWLVYLAAFYLLDQSEESVYFAIADDVHQMCLGAHNVPFELTVIQTGQAK